MRTRPVLRLVGAFSIAAAMSVGLVQPAAAFSQEASDNIAEFFRCKSLMLSDFAAFSKQCGGTPNMTDLSSMMTSQDGSADSCSNHGKKKHRYHGGGGGCYEPHGKKHKKHKRGHGFPSMYD